MEFMTSSNQPIEQHMEICKYGAKVDVRITTKCNETLDKSQQQSSNGKETITKPAGPPPKLAQPNELQRASGSKQEETRYWIRRPFTERDKNSEIENRKDDQRREPEMDIAKMTIHSTVTKQLS